VSYGDNQEEVFLGHSVARQQNVSEDTARKIDAEIKRLVDDGYKTAKTLLTKKRKDLEALAQGLLEFETLSGEEIKDLLNGKPPSRDDEDNARPKAKPGSSVPVTKKKKGDEGSGEMKPQPQA
jgi:cell division protease FtsH